MMWYGGYGQHMSGGGYVLLGLGTLLFWSALILGIVALLRHLGRANGSALAASAGAGPADAERVLADRYARGEIDDDEYHRRVDVLRDRVHRTAAP